MHEPPIEPGASTQPLAGCDSALGHRFTHRAMACEFELVLLTDSARYAAQAARAIFDEIDRLESQLSRFRPASDIARIDALQPGEAVRIGPAAFDCLTLACELYVDTGGAFDITAGSKPPGGGSGMQHLGLNPERCCAGVTAPGVRLDLGGLGKGYALDRAAALLRDWSIPAARLHAGQSTVLGLGAPPGQRGWRIALRNPETGQPAAPLATVTLCNRAISGSDSLLQPGHILDPRTGAAAEGKLGAWALAPSAARSDGLSTAFFIMPVDEVRACCAAHNDVGAILLWREGDDRVRCAWGLTGLDTS